jgi:3-oxosteroid 1-dehydrogenase
MPPVSLTGDGIVLAAEIGGAIHRIHNCLSVMLGYSVPSPEKGKPPVSCRAGIVELLSPHTMLVNRRGQRFTDESFFQGIVPSLRHFDTLSHEQINVPCYLIFDQQYPENFSFANQPAGAKVPDVICRANSLPELAQKLGLDEKTFVATVERFNTFARAGVDDDYHRGEGMWRLSTKEERGLKNPRLGPLEKPPFYGVELLPSVGNAAGILANSHGQAMHQRQLPIEGLYVSGVAAARNEMGAGYQAGLNLASAMTYSYLAVQHMKAAR